MKKVIVLVLVSSVYASHSYTISSEALQQLQAQFSSSVTRHIDVITVKIGGRQ